jgi:hypothetical protein
MTQMANTPVNDGGPRLSPSVTAFNYDQRSMTATALAYALYEGHRDYPQSENALAVMRKAIERGPTRTPGAWIEDVSAQLDWQRMASLPGDDGSLHGRLLVYGLARVDPTLREVLQSAGVLDALRAGMRPDPEELFVSASEAPPPNAAAPPAGLIVHLRALGDNADYGYGFFIREHFVVTSARHRGQLPPMLAVEPIGTGAQSAQARHVAEPVVEELEAFEVFERHPPPPLPPIGWATPSDRYVTVIETAPGSFIDAGGTIVSVTADALTLQPDTTDVTSVGLDGAPLLVNGALVGMVVVDASGDVRGVPIGTIDAAVTMMIDFARSKPGAADELSRDLTDQALDVLTRAEALRLGCGKSDVHMEHLVAALVDSPSGPMLTLIEAVGLTPAGLDAFMAARRGVEWPGPDHRNPEVTGRLTEPPRLSGHGRAALDEAKRIATAHRAQVDEIHLAYGALSVRKCSVIEALAAAEIVLDQLPLRFPSRGEVADVRPDTAEGTDLLGLEREVGALAAVIAAKGVQPPLSVGLFGDWGSGKSFFMNQLADAIAALANEAKVDPAGSMFCEHIVQLTFNAWHYMDVDLWANLAAEVFEQLAAAIDAQTKEQARLDGEPTQRDRLLAAAIHTRDVIAEAERERDAIRTELTETEAMKGMLGERRAELDRRLDTGAIVTEAVANALADDTVKKQLDEAAKHLGITNAKAVAGQVQSQLMELGGIAGWARALMLKWRTGGTKVRLLTAGIVLVTGVLVPLVVTQLEAAGFVRTLTGLATAVAAISALLAPYLKKVHEVTKTVGEIRAKHVRQQEDRLREQRLDNEKRLTEAEDLVKTKRDELAKIEKQLESIRADRRVKDFIDERSRSQDYSKHFGTVARARSDFTRLAKMFAEVQTEIDDGFPRIDRIVLYIDDLDRCPEDKVVAVLQAVHLLLATPLFVVVVGVDSRWLLHSLRQHGRPFQDHEQDGAQVMDPMSDEERLHWKSTPLNYLEKIFQIPFAVRPMEPTGYHRLVDSLASPSKVTGHQPSPLPDRGDATEEHADDTTGGQSADAQAATARTATGGPPAGEATPETPPSTPPDQGRPAQPPPAAHMAVTAPPSRFLEIERWERTAMKRLFPLIPSPRGAKRFVNVYRLLRATLTEEDYDRFVAEQGGDHQVVLLLLAMLTGHPAPTTEIMRDLLDETSTDTDWWDFIKECKLRHPGGDGEEPSEDGSDDARWADLWAALDDVKPFFLAIGSVDRVKGWTRTVARYSFQSSRVLLDRGADATAPPAPTPSGATPNG